MIFQKPFPQIERKKSRKNLGKNFFDLKSVFGNNFKFLSEYLPLVILKMAQEFNLGPNSDYREYS